MKLIIKLFMFVAFFIFFSCKKENDIKSAETNTDVVNDTVYFDSVSFFTPNENQSLYRNAQFNIDVNTSSNKLKINFKNKKNSAIYSTIKGYNGPGYSIYLYENKKSQKNEQFIILELSEEIGSSGYEVIQLKNNKIEKSFLLETSQDNSNTIGIGQFIKIITIGNKIFLKIVKKYLNKNVKMDHLMIDKGEYFLRQIDNFILGNNTDESNLEKIKSNVLKTKNMQLDTVASLDLNMDKIEDKILVFDNKNTEQDLDYDDLQIPLYICFGQGNDKYITLKNDKFKRLGFYELIDKIVVKDNYFTLQFTEEKPDVVFLETFVTFKYDKNLQTCVLHKLSKIYEYGGKTYHLTSKDFGIIRFEDFNSDLIYKLEEQFNLNKVE